MATNRFLETMNIQPVSVNVSSGTAGNSDWVNMANYASCIFVLVAEDGASGDDFEVKVQQAPVAAGTGAKDVEPLDYYAKEVGSGLNAAGSYVLDAGNDFDLDGDDENIIIVEVGADQLDLANNFQYVSMRNDANGAATKTFTTIAILCGARYAVDPTNWPAVDS